MNILVLNAGSATLKFQLFDLGGNRDDDARETRLARGLVDRFGERATVAIEAGGEAFSAEEAIHGHAEALNYIIERLTKPPAGGSIEPVLRSTADLDAVGHRVVHGGERFREAVRIDDVIRDAIAQVSDLAPLHNPHNLSCIDAAIALFGPTIPQVAVFDTAFHATLPEHAFLYAIPFELYERHRVRRYGFHGTSHRYVADRYHAITGSELAGSKLITLHLGNGASACAIADGESVDTSMGLTPLEGLVMGTRSGDIDPAIIEFISRKEGLELARIDEMLNRESGLLGISGRSNDMRDLEAAARREPGGRAALAIRIFAYRVRKYIGAYLAVLGGADAIVFTGGIGENSPAVRAMICEGLGWTGLEIDPVRNERVGGRVEGRISTDGSPLAAWVIPTDEELVIARDTARVVGRSER